MGISSVKPMASAAASLSSKHSWPSRLGSLFPMIVDVFSGAVSSVSRFGVLASLAGILYVLSPLDVIPELFLGPFGLADDAAIGVLAVTFLLRSVDKYLDEVTEPAVSPEVVPGKVYRTE